MRDEKCDSWMSHKAVDEVWDNVLPTCLMTLDRRKALRFAIHPCD